MNLDHHCKVTVIFPLFQAELAVKNLLSSVFEQKNPDYNEPSQWLSVLFIDNASTDQTISVLEKELKNRGNPSWIKVIVNEKNLGLSKSLNRAFRAVSTPYALTCHADCLFDDSLYIATMLQQMENHPKVGAITGMPTVSQSSEIPKAEKINFVTNLMDIFSEEDSDFSPTGFAEGRCDLFRMEAIKKAGFYDETLKFAGEDQILASKLRENGYQILKANHLKYRLSLSAQQDSLLKLSRHQQMFGRAHPFILFKHKGTSSGITETEVAGKNRQMRALLRLHQLFFGGLILISPLLFFISAKFTFSLLIFILLSKTFFFHTRIKALKLDFKEVVLLFSLQPFFDLRYTLGVFQGFFLLATDKTID
ncbi:MAG: hypothetical protein CL678_18585 [Bdellovibrionaceae bacterium]|nr:hypothetical protein [Pseudobdellovibrionaceae bacterium]|tara:strand:- start:1007 stop:2101 length:1095 start_codon:yes stop_codon:yes gene_type:complete